MKKKSKFRLIVKRILLFGALFLLLILGVFYFIVIHNFKESVRYIVKTESKGAYIFDAGSASISIFKKQIIFKDASLHRVDSATASMHYELDIPDLDFSFFSWRDLIFYKKIRVKNLTLLNPSLVIHDHNLPNDKKKEKFKPAEILRFLDNTLLYLNVKSLSVQNGSFIYSKREGPAPFESHDINISISDFAKVDDNDAHLLGSEKITVQLGKQHWVMPDGKTEIAFNRLNFYSEGQRFEVDSFSLKRYETEDEGEMNFKVNKFFFNSKHLPALYQKEKLLIDTMYFLNPHLSVYEDSNEKNKWKNDTLPMEATDYLFKMIQINYISVLDAELTINNRESKKRESEKNNIFIYNLTIDNEKNGAVSTDSIRLNLNAIEFYNKDSLFKLRINQFTLNNNAAIFTGVSYGPSEYNKIPGGVTFSAPSFILNKIDIPELIKGHIKASDAVLSKPYISILQKKNHLTASQKKKKNTQTRTAFFKNLQTVNDLIDINELKIIDGKGKYRSWDQKTLSIDVSGIAAIFKLDDLEYMEEIPDLQYAVATIGMKQVHISSPTFIGTINQYVLDGKRKESKVDELKFQLKNGTDIHAKNLVWKNLDWDLLQEKKQLKLEAVTAEEVEVNLKKMQPDVEKKNVSFSIDIDRVAIGKINFINAETASLTSFRGNNFEILGLQNQLSHWNWLSARFNLKRFLHQQNNMHLQFDSLLFENQFVKINGVKWEDSSLEKQILFETDSLKLITNIHSTDIRHLQINELMAANGKLDLSIFKKAEQAKPAPTLPFPISLNKILLSDFDVHFKKSDSLLVNANVNIYGKNLDIPKDEDIFTIDSLSIALMNLQFINPSVTLAGSQFQIDLGKILVQPKAFHFMASVDLKADSLSGTWQSKENTLSISDLNFEFRNNDFRWNENIAKNLQWFDFLPFTKLQTNQLFFRNKDLHASVEKLDFNPVETQLTLVKYVVAPNQTKEESFANAKWQNDYVVLKGDSLMVNLGTIKKDFPIHIKQVALNGFNIDISRDKRIPFEHGVEKLMPTKMIQTIPFPIRLDSIKLNKGIVNYHEYSVATNHWVLIPFANMNGSITNITNVFQEQDSLGVSLSSALLDGSIQGFNYRESYSDSLSGYVAENHLAPSGLTSFSAIAHPLAGALIERGRVDTMFARWQGNKYAAVGTMNFHYKDLKIKLMDQSDINKQSFGSSLKTFAVNLFLPNKKKKTSYIYFERDREKFIFNYWIKTHANGLISTVGLKGNKKQMRNYKRNIKRFSLPNNLLPL